MEAKAIYKTFEHVEHLIECKKYTTALSILKSMNKKSLQEAEKALYNLLYVKACTHLGKYNIEVELKDALDYYRASADNKTYANIKYYQGLLDSKLGYYINAKEAFLESYLTYKRLNNKKEQAVVLNYIAFIQNQLGDYSSAIDTLQTCLGLVEKDDHQRKFIFNMNIAQLYRMIGCINKANSTLSQIEFWSENSGKNNNAAYLILSSMLNSQLGNYRTSKAILGSALSIIVDFPREQAIYFETLGWIHNLEGNYDSALIELIKGLGIAEEIAPNSALMSQIKRRMSDSYLGLEDYPNAAKYAAEALVVAEKLNERVEIAECWRIQAQIANHHGEGEKARGLFKQAIDMFKMIGTQYNLALCRYIAATSGLYHNGERQALLYLAREYFASEDVHHYIEKIDAEFKKNAQSNKPVLPSQNAPIVVAESEKMKKIIETAQVMSQSQMSVLLTGDTGTGKDLIARYIHDCSGCKGEFVLLNIAAIPESMLEAELFGYRKGAFTGSLQARTGLLEQANNGTFFLNEVNSAPMAIQAKLLHVLENQCIRRLGENTEREVSFRLISATNHDLEELIRRNEFRADFYHRIKQVEIALPSLMERPEDIPALIQYFLSQVGLECDESQAQTIASRFESHLWPGNVRELKAEIEKLAVLSGKNIEKLITILATNNDNEKAQLQTLLEKHNWNRSKVADVLGISEGGVRYRMRKFKLL